MKCYVQRMVAAQPYNTLYLFLNSPLMISNLSYGEKWSHGNCSLWQLQSAHLKIIPITGHPAVGVNSLLAFGLWMLLLEKIELFSFTLTAFSPLLPLYFIGDK